MIIPFERSFWVIPNLFLAGGIPAAPQAGHSFTKLNSLKKTGIKVVLNLMEPTELNNQGEPFFNYPAFLPERGIQFIRKPIIDGGIPSTDLMVDILDTIDLQVNAQLPLYLHCYGGIGRTGLVVGCYLLRHGYATKANVIDMIAYLKRTTSIQNRRSPESDIQRQFLFNWSYNQ
jgi:protein-tyrosine phosphatase